MQLTANYIPEHAKYVVDYFKDNPDQDKFFFWLDEVHCEVYHRENLPEIAKVAVTAVEGPPGENDICRVRQPQPLTGEYCWNKTKVWRAANDQKEVRAN